MVTHFSSILFILGSLCFLIDILSLSLSGAGAAGSRRACSGCLSHWGDGGRGGAGSAGAVGAGLRSQLREEAR